MNYQGPLPGSLYSLGGKRKYLTASERAQFLVAAENCPRPELRSFCLTLAYTGCRISEALAVTAGAVERACGFIAVRSLKKRKNIYVVREIPVPNCLFEAIDAAHDLSMLNPDARLWKWSRCHAWLLVKGILADAGIPPGIHATPKGLRHGYGLHAINCGIPLNLVQRWLGHARMETTAIYLQAIGMEEREIAQRMWNSK